jgi:autotransporter-associated beta strand protein
MLGTGGITVNGATLQALNHHQFGFNAGTHNAITLNDGATLATGAYDQFLGALAINGNATITGTGNYIGLAGGSLTYVGDSSSKQATIAPSIALFNSTVAVDATLSVTGTNAAGDLVINGVIWQNGAGITKSGTGKLVLNAANTYTGATRVNAGTLALGASGSVSGSSGIHVASGSTFDVSAKSGFTLASGQTLSGGGTVVGDTVIAGTHTPGFSPGLQTFADNVTYADGSTVVWELAAGSASGRGTIFDGIDVQGNLAFQGTVNLSLVFDLAGSDVDWTAPFWDTGLVGTAGWKVFGVTGTVNGFANLQIANADWLDANGAAFSTARPNGSFSLYQGGDGIYLNYTPVPEPSTYGLILGALALAGAAVRRRKISK